MKKFQLLPVAILLASATICAQDLMQSPSQRKSVPQLTNENLSPNAQPASVAPAEPKNNPSIGQPATVAKAENHNEILDENADPLAIVQASFRRLSQINAFRMQIKMSGKGESDQVLLAAEIQNPNRVHSYMQDTETIEIGTSSWKRGKEGQWESLEKKTNMQIEDMLNLLFKMMHNPSVARGDEKVGEMAMKTFVFTSSEKIGEGYPVLKVWIGATNGLLYQCVMGSTYGDIVTTYQFYDFNAPIKVNPPRL